MKWTFQQTAIFDWGVTGEGNLAVRARAGAGKTSTIIELMKRLPWPKEGLLAAFNKHSAEDLQAKLGISSPHKAQTLHSLGFQILKERFGSLKLNRRRTKELVEKAGGKGKRAWKLAQLCTTIKDAAPWAKSRDEVLSAARRLDALIDQEDVELTHDAQADVVLKVMELSMKVDGEIDFSDMVFVPYRGGWKPLNRYDVVAIDEAQDMNPGQLALAARAVKDDGRVIVVGDDRQALYQFRGATEDGFDEMKRRLNATELPLTVSFRCSKKVIREAQTLVSDITARRDAPDGNVDRLGETEMMEAVIDILSDPDNKLSMFFLSRFNAPLFPLALQLLQNRVAFKIQGNEYGEKIVDLIEKLKPISRKDMALKLKLWREQRFKQIPKGDDPEDLQARADVQDLYQAISVVNEQVDVDQLVLTVKRLFEADSRSGITLSTVHRAKGREADIVFVLENTLVTRNPKLQKIFDLTEAEYNIEYVAITRAKLELWWVDMPFTAFDHLLESWSRDTDWRRDT